MLTFTSTGWNTHEVLKSKWFIAWGVNRFVCSHWQFISLKGQRQQEQSRWTHHSRALHIFSVVSIFRSFHPSYLWNCLIAQQQGGSLCVSAGLLNQHSILKWFRNISNFMCEQVLCGNYMLTFSEHLFSGICGISLYSRLQHRLQCCIKTTGLSKSLVVRTFLWLHRHLYATWARICYTDSAI